MSAEPDTESVVGLTLPGKPLQVVPPAEHGIREQDIDREALKVLYRLRDAGFAGYLVGGGVRDLYLGKKPKDFDISTDARPGQLRRIFRNSRTIGRRFRLVQVYFRGNKIIEVSTLRSRREANGDDDDAVLAANNTYGTLEDDAFRRDLTINALFYEIAHHCIIDYVGGVSDLDQGVVRLVGDPSKRIIRDPVRMMRAIRHAARIGFRLEPATWGAICGHVDALRVCPPSRIRDELLKDLRSGASYPWARLCLQSKLWFTLFPMYEEVLTGEADVQCREELLAVLGVLDRLQKQETVRDGRVFLPDYLLFAAVLLPWIQRKLQLLEASLKGAGYGHLLLEIRNLLNQGMGEQLNLPRMARDHMATLLVNLPNMHQYRRKKGWPAWLRRKSYFQDCRRFYLLYQEALGGPPVKLDYFVEPVATVPVLRGQRRGRGRSSGRRGRVNPSFSSRKTGVFGLRK